MHDGMTRFAILAAEAAPDMNTLPQLLVMVVGGMVIVFIIQMLFGRPEAKERARREQLISNLKKNDPVVTIGGILGHVASVSEDKKEVTIRVDDNTRIKFQATAIRESLAPPPKDKEKAAE